MKVALVHDWLLSMRGGERCFEILCELFPEADVFTLLHKPGGVTPAIERHPLHTSFIQCLPRAERYYRYCLPLFPMAIERFDFDPYDLVISSSHCVAKGAKRSPRALHISYTYTPMRYAWDLYDDYFGGWASPIKSLILPRVMASLRQWDVAACERVDHFVAISRHIAERIRRHYGRESTVVYPPVDVDRFRVSQSDEGYYLIVSAWVPYKRLDLAVQAFNRLRLPLKIVGWGPEEQRLRALAGPTVEILGKRTDEELVPLYAGCRGLIFPGEEDFGIVPLEAHASGKPVVAYAKGGALETVVPLNPRKAGLFPQTPPTGVWFYEQTVDDLVDAVKVCEKERGSFDPEVLRDQARRFDRPLFKERIRSLIADRWARFRDRRDAQAAQ